MTTNERTLRTLTGVLAVLIILALGHPFRAASQGSDLVAQGRQALELAFRGSKLDSYVFTFNVAARKERLKDRLFNWFPFSLVCEPVNLKYPCLLLRLGHRPA